MDNPETHATSGHKASKTKNIHIFTGS